MVMRRVRMVFVVRSLIVPTVLELTFVGSFIGAVIAFVSVEDVFKNFKTTISEGSVFEYTYDAVTHTELLVQLAMTLFLAVSGYFGYRLIKTIRSASFRDTVEA